MFDFISIFVCFALTSGLRSDAIHHQHQSRLSSKLYCVLPPYPAHGTYIVLDEAEPGQAVSGTALSISCDPGYEVPGLNEIIVCYKSLWSRDVPDCKLKVDKCVLPPYPAHGSYRVDGMTRTVPGQEFPTVALTIICNPGYGIEGEKQRTCLNGIWSGSIPDCKETLGACILPPFPENGSYAVVGAPDAVPGQAFDNIALIISCNFGHAIPGRKDRTCYMGIWSEEMYDCVPTSELCVLPPFPDYGSYVVLNLPHNSFTPGQVYDFVLVETLCDEEYESLHHSYTECRDGSWLNDMECVPKTPTAFYPDYDYKEDVRSEYLDPVYNISISNSACILPPQPGNGSYSVIGVPNVALDQAFDNVALIISCNPGFGISGKKDRTCFNGIWSENITDCVPISDLDPPTRYFMSLGSSNLQPHLEISDNDDKCVLPPYPDHGSYEVGGMTRTVPGQALLTVALTIICNPGYDIKGDKQRICFNGIWSGSIPDCKETGLCILPPFPGNGSYAVVGAPDAVPGQAFDNVAIIISCNFGYAVPGRKDRTCYMGIWSEEINDCVPTSELCVLPPFPDHGSYIVRNLPKKYFTPGQVYDFVEVEIICDDEYERIDGYYLICRQGYRVIDLKCMPKTLSTDPDYSEEDVSSDTLDLVSNYSVSNSACILPPQPGNGSYSVIGVPNAALGQAFDNVALMIACNTGFGISGRKDRTCFNGIWLANITDCVPISDLKVITPPTTYFTSLRNSNLQAQLGTSDSCYLEENPTINYRCLLSPTSKETRECNLEEPVGTIVRPECKDNFFYPGVQNLMRCFASGWNFVPSCIPECGYSNPTFRIEYAAVGGNSAKRGEVPWHAGIYDKMQDYEQICGGTIIRPTVVVSAGHCFVDGMAVAQPASRYAVAVGKLMRSWYTSKDKNAQKFNVTEVIIPKGFQGSKAHFQEDIALVFLDQPIMFTTLIQPVCLDFSPEIEKEQLQKGNLGMVAGWGLISENNKDYSSHLQVLDLPYVPIEECQAQAPLDFRSSITGDKICAGYTKNKAVCKGDSGGGLAFPLSPKLAKDKVRYYLRGIVSTAPVNETLCNIRWYATYTHLSRHERFIKEFVK